MHLHAIVLFHGLAAHGLSFDSVMIGLRPLKALGFQLLRLTRRRDVQQLALILAFLLAIWVVKRWVDRWEARQRREDARRCALDVAVTLAKSIQLCEDVRLALQGDERVPDATVEAALEALDHSRQSLRLYLSRPIPLHELIPLATAAEMRLHEGHRAMLTLHEPPADAERDPHYAGQLQSVRAELQVIVDRLRGLEPDLGRAIAKVDAGWALND